MSTVPDPSHEDLADHFLPLQRYISDQCVLLPIDSLLPADSPRLDGENTKHVRAIAELDDELQPIIVHKGSMRVIDGMHRLRARAERGDTTIRARYFSGSEGEAFLFAVQSNTKHGLPLTREDRRAAAERIIRTFPAMSDRALSKFTGLAQQTVARIRQQLPPCRSMQSRIGVDGRARPVNPKENRRIAEEFLKENPHASLRQIARAANISPSTAQDVRRRTIRQHGSGEPVARRLTAGSPGNGQVPDPGLLHDLALLARDPSVRHTEAGRMLVQWLRLTMVVGTNHTIVANSVPEHCAEIAARAMRVCTTHLEEFVRKLEQR
ncbi:streptomycin biosynthesis regulator [Streptomyces botrytidirepellens]|uniref:Streptomycin biosynthesis regulator n=1 Tax=Streptomyces botrytidirepellens TaxID=2486417 RepID=A0A3M8WSG9_9ACTN|nr:streptomycin biosynthesis regulator [Streptomyces botrytidirepellens]